ncbi:hypothetical protein AMAG_20395 [Allomyces macrogynus ATCC 38327]|uniref:Uncharacterized protein n=1 Tax=Allomyces macrogynus (strain ATCC 38327) TaxID=578462 RepID=A0A0L0T9Z3_ALLM3|nr:hypothetical protein AMAG_20395 [Allomyces macrogynus ATCC 38327]|eukprot:KNE71562.1 hypothetical protein AMAG_20395 [Allomyces macrogynus ATCC 38327]
MPASGVGTVLPFVIVFEMVSGCAITANSWHEMRATGIPGDCLREWSGGEAMLAASGELLNGQIPRAAVAPRLELAPLVVTAFVTADVGNAACRDGMAAVAKFAVQVPQGIASLIVVLVAKVGVDREAAAAWSEVLRVACGCRRWSCIAWTNGVSAASRDLAETLEVRPAMLGMVGPPVHAYRRDSDVCVGGWRVP